MSIDELRKKRKILHENSKILMENMNMISDESKRVSKIAGESENILNSLDEQFCKKTGLNKTDVNFLFCAIGLQLTRQYLITKFPIRLDDQTAAKNTFGHNEEHSNRMHKYYNPSMEEIITNPVPFDANIGANGALSGGGKMGHRVTAIGHDPILGLIFGTANIATSTLTTSSFDSFHIYTNSNNRDFFKNHARTDLVLSKTVDKLVNQGIEGKSLVALSLIKEIIHLNSDLNTKHSLPLPMISTFNPKLASELAKYGFDMANVINVGKQASYAVLINSIIAMIHRLFCESTDSNELNLYEVRTRKILSYSNLVASSSNFVITYMTKNVNLLDVGGLGVTIYRLITDAKFIQEVKKEFVYGSFKEMIEGNHLNLKEIYKYE